MPDDFDLVIVGGGLAGLTAAMYGARFGLRTMLIEQLVAGGQVLNVEKIENFPVLHGQAADLLVKFGPGGEPAWLHGCAGAIRHIRGLVLG